MVISMCDSYEVTRLDNEMDATTKRIVSRLSVAPRRNFLRSQQRWRRRLETKCDAAYGNDLFKPDTDTDPYANYDYEACWLIETANRVRWLRKHYHRPLGR